MSMTDMLVDDILDMILTDYKRPDPRQEAKKQQNSESREQWLERHTKQVIENQYGPK